GLSRGREYPQPLGVSVSVSNLCLPERIQGALCYTDTNYSTTRKKPIDEWDLPCVQGGATGYDDVIAGGLLALGVYGYQA
ncbi:MAG: hypothetical protein LBI76_06300, partial [Comamonas sp.]|nr:hypothetical protein [Comamonas sp.]